MASRSDDGEGRAQHNAVGKHSEYQPISVTLRVTAAPGRSLLPYGQFTLSPQGEPQSFVIIYINLNNSQLIYKRINIREVITKNGKIIWY